jgi:hypothetical protein
MINSVVEALTIMYPNSTTKKIAVASTQIVDNWDGLHWTQGNLRDIVHKTLCRQWRRKATCVYPETHLHLQENLCVAIYERMTQC